MLQLLKYTRSWISGLIIWVNIKKKLSWFLLHGSNQLVSEKRQMSHFKSILISIWIFSQVKMTSQGRLGHLTRKFSIAKILVFMFIRKYTKVCILWCLHHLSSAIVRRVMIELPQAATVAFALPCSGNRKNWNHWFHSSVCFICFTVSYAKMIKNYSKHFRSTAAFFNNLAIILKLIWPEKKRTHCSFGFLIIFSFQ